MLEVGFIEVSRTVWFGEAWKNEECVCKRERWSYFCMWHPVQESMMLRRSPLKEAVSVHVSSTLSTVPYGSIISLNIFQTYSRRVEKRNVRNECEIYAKDCQRMWILQYNILIQHFTVWFYLQDLTLHLLVFLFSPHVVGIPSGGRQTLPSVHSIQNMTTSKRCCDVKFMDWNWLR